MRRLLKSEEDRIFFISAENVVDWLANKNSP